MQAALLPGLDGTGALHGDFVAAMGDLPCTVLRYPPGMTAYRDLAQYAAPQLPAGDFILIAESFSGPLALRLLDQNLPRLKGLKGIVFVASFAKRPLPAPPIAAKALGVLPLGSRLLCRMMQPLIMGAWANKASTGALYAALQTVPATTLARRLAQVLQADETAALSRASLPMLYLQASSDRLVPRRAGRVFRQAGVAMKTLDGPHFLLQASPVEAARIIAQFAQRHASASA